MVDDETKVSPTPRARSIVAFSYVKIERNKFAEMAFDTRSCIGIVKTERSTFNIV